ncbi:hypothetical protein ARMSODRAFT_1019998 [Armillaria solidipes]|uniref:Uncharacterized protein n=1 Tax=Armillaria solidipes TaxID=1076256 RepID=A0A2H3BGB0_9AGAR|nr:hypothetical protein ARMSODRAFT_1019998 [Armillaria solidipes]
MHVTVGMRAAPNAPNRYMLPSIEKALEELLGDGYIDGDWRPVLSAIMAAENDVNVALRVIEALTPKAIPTASSTQSTMPKELANAEKTLENRIIELKERNHIHGAVPTLEDLLNPAEEEEIGEPEYQFGSDEEIIEVARYQLAVERGEIQEIEEDEEDEDEGDEGEPLITSEQGIELCCKLEILCNMHGDVDISSELQTHLRCF